MDVISAGLFAEKGRLWIEMPGEVPTPHRVVIVGKPQLAEIDGRRQRAVLVRDVDSRGDQRLVPVGELAEARPLTPAERAECDRLDAELAGTNGDRRKLRAFYALVHRQALFGVAA